MTIATVRRVAYLPDGDVVHRYPDHLNPRQRLVALTVLMPDDADVLDLGERFLPRCQSCEWRYRAARPIEANPTDRPADHEETTA